MVAVNKKFISRVESPEVFECGDTCGFAVFAAVAAFAGKDQVPDSVEVCAEIALQGVREKVIDIAEGTCFGAVCGGFFGNEKDVGVVRFGEGVIKILRTDHRRRAFRVADGDVVKTVEAFAFLVSVQGGAGGCDGLAAVFRRDREKVADFAVFDGKEAGGYLLFPGGLDQAPAGLGFHTQVA